MNNISSIQYFTDNSNLIIDNSKNMVIIDNCRNNLDFVKDFKFNDNGVYQFNNTIRFKLKVDMLYNDPSKVTIGNNLSNDDLNNYGDISRNEDFIITSLDNNIHIVTKPEKNRIMGKCNIK